MIPRWYGIMTWLKHMSASKNGTVPFLADTLNWSQDPTVAVLPYFYVFLGVYL
jgi:hypothetical protein